MLLRDDGAAGQARGGRGWAGPYARATTERDPVLGVVLIDAMVVGRGGSVYRHCPRAHQLAFSPPLCRPASRALERRSHFPTPTSHALGVWLVSGVARSHRPAAPCGLHPATQRRQACTSADERPGCAAQKASWEELEALKAPVCLLPARVPHHAHRRTRRHPPRCASTRF